MIYYGNDKKELEYLNNLKMELSFRRTDKIVPDLLPPDYLNNRIINGYSYNLYALRVEKACTSSISHSFGNWDKTTSQNTLELYSTRLLALKAMRYEFELKCAAELYKIDNMIEKENNNG